MLGSTNKSGRVSSLLFWISRIARFGNTSRPSAQCKLLDFKYMAVSVSVIPNKLLPSWKLLLSKRTDFRLGKSSTVKFGNVVSFICPRPKFVIEIGNFMIFMSSVFKPCKPRRSKLVKRSSLICLNAEIFLIPKVRSSFLRDFDAGPKSKGNTYSEQKSHKKTLSSGLWSNVPYFISVSGLWLIKSFCNLGYSGKLPLLILLRSLYCKDRYTTIASISWGTDVRLALSLMTVTARRTIMPWANIRIPIPLIRPFLLAMWSVGMLKCGHWKENQTTLKESFMGPTWSTSGADRTKLGPCWPHELCYLGIHRDVQ